MCVQLAHTRGFKSLAMPALGTGNLHYPKREVAACMIDSLIELGTGDKEAPSFSVRFIMHSKDYDVIQVITKVIMNCSAFHYISFLHYIFLYIYMSLSLWKGVNSREFKCRPRLACADCTTFTLFVWITNLIMLIWEFNKTC